MPRKASDMYTSLEESALQLITNEGRTQGFQPQGRPNVRKKQKRGEKNT